MKKYVIFYLTIAALTLTVGQNAFGRTNAAESINPFLCISFQTKGGKDYGTILWANWDNPLCVAARKWLNEEKFTVLGIPSSKENEEQFVKDYLWTIENSEVWKQKLKAGMTKSDAFNFIQQTSKPADYRIYNIFSEIYGRPIDKAEDFFLKKAIETKELWYQKIYDEQLGKLANDPKAKEAVVERAYQEALGRAAYLAELKNWRIKVVTYKKFVEILRSLLYSAAGADDLRTAVRTKLFQKNKKAAAEAEIVAAINKYTPGRKIFSEMD